MPGPLHRKTFILGVTGSIAAVKAPMVAREIMRRGGAVVAALTEGAQQFTTPLAFSALTHEEVITETFPRSLERSAQAGTWHITLAHRAAGMLIAPCSATTLGKLASGIYDNAVTLLAAALPIGVPLFIAPAMDTDMWNQPAVQENISKLKSLGAIVIAPASGLLASGLSGEGRMPEPTELVDRLVEFFGDERLPLSGKRFLITGGPTYEPIDPVRFLGNRSSGKMAAALADAADRLGAEVTLIMGPSAARTDGIRQRIDVETANEMQRAVEAELPTADVIIMNAAVSDFGALHESNAKLKKRDLADVEGKLSLQLIKTPDILSGIAAQKRPTQFLVGFALETGEKAEEYARGKLREKGLDMVVLNRADESGAGFSVDTNKVTIFTNKGEREELPLLSKEECATRILLKIAALL